MRLQSFSGKLCATLLGALVFQGVYAATPSFSTDQQRADARQERLNKAKERAREKANKNSTNKKSDSKKSSTKKNDSMPATGPKGKTFSKPKTFAKNKIFSINRGDFKFRVNCGRPNLMGQKNWSIKKIPPYPKTGVECTANYNKRSMIKVNESNFSVKKFRQVCRGGEWIEKNTRSMFSRQDCYTCPGKWEIPKGSKWYKNYRREAPDRNARVCVRKPQKSRVKGTWKKR